MDHISGTDCISSLYSTQLLLWCQQNLKKQPDVSPCTTLITLKSQGQQKVTYVSERILATLSLHLHLLSACRAPSRWRRRGNWLVRCTTPTRCATGWSFWSWKTFCWHWSKLWRIESHPFVELELYSKQNLVTELMGHSVLSREKESENAIASC